MINQSFMSYQHGKSTFESTIQYQNGQMKLMRLLKILTFIIGCVFLVGLVYFIIDYRANRGRVIVDEGGDQETDVSEGGRPDGDDLWYYPNLRRRVCGQVSVLENKVVNQLFSVSDRAEGLPSYDQINEKDLRNEDGSYKQPSPQEADAKLKSVVSGFNDLIAVNNLDLPSKDSEFERLDTLLDDSRGEFKEAEKLLDNEYLFDIKLNINDLTNSHSNLVTKKKQLNRYRKELFFFLNSLETNKQRLQDLTEKQTRKEELVRDSERKLTEAKDRADLIKEKVADKEKNLTDEEKKSLAELREVGDKIEDIKYRIKNKDKVKANCKKYKAKIDENEKTIDQNNITLSGYLVQINNYEDDRRDLSSQLKDKKDSRKMREVEKSVLTSKLSTYLQDQSIKNFLGKLVNEKSNMSELSQLIDKKINDEKQLVDEINQYKELKKSLNITFTISEEDSDKITPDVKKNTDNFKKIMNRYIGLKKVVDEYEDPELKIEILTSDIQKIEDDQRALDKEIARLENELGRIENKLKTLQAKTEYLTDKNTNLSEENEAHKTYIEESEVSLNEAQANLKQLEESRERLEKVREVSL